jgi:hypothetical protein
MNISVRNGFVPMTGLLVFAQVHDGVPFLGTTIYLSLALDLAGEVEPRG